MTLTLDELPFGTPARVVSVDWDHLAPADAQKLRNLGLDHGVGVETLHNGPIGRCPIAVRIGRMTIAMRRAYARAIMVDAVEADAVGTGRAAR